MGQLKSPLCTFFKHLKVCACLLRTNDKITKLLELKFHKVIGPKVNEKLKVLSYNRNKN